MNTTPTAPDHVGDLLRSIASGLGLGLTRPPMSRDERTAQHRSVCLALAVASLPKDVSTYDRIAAADYLENGYHAEPEEAPACSCQNAEASHPLGDEAYCEMRQ